MRIDRSGADRPSPEASGPARPGRGRAGEGASGTLPLDKAGRPAPPGRAGVDLGGIFLSGFEGCASEALGMADGTAVVRLTNRSADGLALAKATPGDAFGVAICLDVQTCEVRHGHRLVRSGRLPAGCVSFQQPGQHVAVATTGTWDTLFFSLPRGAVRRVCERSGVDLDVEQLEFFDPPARSEPQMLDFARRVRGEIGSTRAFARLRVDLIAQDLIIHMLRSHSSAADALGGGPPGPARGGLAPRRLRRVLDAMDGMLERQVALAALAELADCSPTHFSRAFRQSTGVPPFAWLLGRRVERAKQLLEAGDLTIAEVALAVGFSAQAQFTTAFKRATGSTPGAWRRQSR